MAQATTQGPLIAVTEHEGRMFARCPYHPAFPARARELSGRWNGQHWVFDSRYGDYVRALLREFYGTDGSDSEDLVTVRITTDGSTHMEWSSPTHKPLMLGGYPIAQARGRDSGARLGEHVVVLEGAVISGGSVKNWCVRVAPGSVIDIVDIPRGMAELMVEQCESQWLVTSAEIREAAGARRAALEAERQRLVERIAEIDDELAKLG